jgi:hypothetical protein
LTPEVQDTEIFCLGMGWLLVEGGLEGGPFDGSGEAGRKERMARLRATMKKYGLDDERLWTEYDKRYLAAHGVDLAKIKAELRRRGRERMERRFKGHPAERAEVEKYLKEHSEAADQFLLPPEPGEEPDPSLPELDDGLLEEVIPNLVTDRSAFYEAASEILTPRIKRKSGYDDVFGDLQGLTVDGDTAKGWVVWSRSRMENGTRDVWEPVRVLRKFRRLDGRWYNDDPSNDLTRFDEAEAKGREAGRLGNPAASNGGARDVPGAASRRMPSGGMSADGLGPGRRATRAASPSPLLALPE